MSDNDATTRLIQRLRDTSSTYRMPSSVPKDLYEAAADVISEQAALIEDLRSDLRKATEASSV